MLSEQYNNNIDFSLITLYDHYYDIIIIFTNFYKKKKKNT
jgi:hypothetical protein